MDLENARREIPSISRRRAYQFTVPSLSLKFLLNQARIGFSLSQSLLLANLSMRIAIHPFSYFLACTLAKRCYREDVYQSESKLCLHYISPCPQANAGRPWECIPDIADMTPLTYPSPPSSLDRRTRSVPGAFQDTIGFCGKLIDNTNEYWAKRISRHLRISQGG